MTGLSVTILVAAFCIIIAGLFAVIVERTNERDEARAELTKAKARAETFADELVASQCANEILCVELAAADEQRRRLAAQIAPVIPIQRDGAHDRLAALDAEATAYTWPAIARDAFPIQQWGEDADR